ncbi:NAD(P)-binding protein, partial [Serendipita vermifera]
MSYHYQNTDRYHNIVTLNLPLMRKDLTGRTVIVTGANVGLGLEGARHFHAMNPARLILAVRDVSKGETAKQSILDTATKVKKTGETKLEVWQLDLNSSKSTNKFAKRCEEELDRLDILLCSAAVAAGEFILTEGGYESTVQTNVLCTFQHIALLLPLMNKTVHLPAPVEGVKLKPHIAIATSGTHATAAFPERDAPKIYKVLNDPSSFEIFERYAASKLMNFLLTRKLSTSP